MQRPWRFPNNPLIRHSEQASSLHYLTAHLRPLVLLQLLSVVPITPSLSSLVKSQGCNSVALLLSFTVTSDPFSRSSCIVPVFPPSAARCNGVIPLPSFTVASAPLSSSNRTLSSDLYRLPAARCNGVTPFSSFAFLFAPLSINNCITELFLPAQTVHHPQFGVCREL